MDDDRDLSIRRQPRMLRESAARFGVHLENLSPIGAAHDWTGQSRRRLVLDYLRGVPDDEVVLLTDAWDSFFSGTPAQMEAAFHAIDRPVVISAETNLWPPEIANHVQHPPCPTRFRYACGGGWAGYAGALAAMFSSDEFWPEWAICDQAAFDQWCVRHPLSATVDCQCRLFFCMYDDGKQQPPINSLYQIHCDGIFVQETGTFPLVWHGGGGFSMQAIELWDEYKRNRQWT